MHSADFFSALSRHIKREKQLFTENRSEINLFCAGIFEVISQIMVVIFFVLLIAASPFFSRVYFFSYFFCFIFFAVLSWLFKRSIKNGGIHALRLVYAFVIVLYIFAIFISIQYLDRSHPATTFACLQVLFPLLIFDRSYRINIITLGVYILHSVLSYLFKNPQSFLLDVSTIGAFTVVGMIVGEYERWLKLKDLEKDRILIHQRDTDSLTGLSNRRMLFETLNDVKEHSKPLSGLFMIDIDHFKIYNDTLGHQAGDQCLEKLGQCFIQFGKENGFQFFRYGGEEFIALSKTDTYEQLCQHAEKLRKTVCALNIPFEKSPDGVVTISIGYASHFCTQDYEESIRIADAALYEAKEKGRNCTRGGCRKRNPPQEPKPSVTL